MGAGQVVNVRVRHVRVGGVGPEARPEVGQHGVAHCSTQVPVARSAKVDQAPIDSHLRRCPISHPPQKSTKASSCHCHKDPAPGIDASCRGHKQPAPRKHSPASVTRTQRVAGWPASHSQRTSALQGVCVCYRKYACPHYVPTLDILNLLCPHSKCPG